MSQMNIGDPAEKKIVRTLNYHYKQVRNTVQTADIEHLYQYCRTLSAMHMLKAFSNM